MGLGCAALRSAEAFFDGWFVLNYCPLIFLEASCRNFTPDKLPAAERRAVHEARDRHLAAALEALQPEWAIGVGGYAERCLRSLLEGADVHSALARRIRVGQILHPSPASPAANRGWNDAVERTFVTLGLLPQR